MRSLIVLLLLALFFLTGLVVGMDSGQMDASRNPEEVEVQDKTGKTEQIMIVEQSSGQLPDKSVQPAETSMNLTQKAAMFLGDVVEGMYEMIVGMIYQIVKVFF